MKKAIILLSGGMDSTVALVIAKNEGFDLFALSFNYKQRHYYELIMAKEIAKLYKIEEHLILDLDLRPISNSVLTSKTDCIPKGRTQKEIETTVPITYVPARNTIFLSYALAWAETLEISDVFVGMNILDYNGYPDCRPEYLMEFEALANIGTQKFQDNKFKIHAPLINMDKSEIIKKGVQLGIDFSMTLSCYDPLNGKSCRNCDACLLRKRGFEEAGIKDNTDYI